ncbi:L-glutamine:2-deoxy-scyllo-inosose aminotransferase [mine drainage metagenome]|uniref:L-glutamine:2-deoxy-scyllo-inosose aminotransferase n=1 Tax=mine drainage metagenome TaxID=410659 RepID=A0A1J5RAE0_9ZZZZ
MTDLMREAPPTAGLPLSWRDFMPGGGALKPGLATFLDQPEVQIESSGTAALVVALTTLKRMSDRRSVVIPAYTCPLVALAVAQCGLKPVVCDSRRNHFDLCPESLAAVCGDDTLAVLVTHLGGRVANVEGAAVIARRAGAYVVEDAAQSLGALWQGRPVGSFGDIGFYSLGVGKGLTIFGGGVLVARSEDMRRRLRATGEEIVPSRIGWEMRRWLELAGYFLLYRPAGLGLAFGMPLRRRLRKGQLIEAVGDDCSAEIPLHRVGAWRKSIGARALKRLPTFLGKTAAQALQRKVRLAAVPGVVLMDDVAGSAGTWPFFLLLMPTRQARDRVLEELWPAGLGVGRLFIHAIPDYSYLSSLFPGADVPNARDFASRALSITNSPWLRDEDFIRICSVLEQAPD